MNILFMDWKCFGREDVIETFEQLGHTVFNQPADDIITNQFFSMEYIERYKKAIENHKIDLVFSMNYFPSVSESCNAKGIPYLSFVYDNPYSKIYNINVINDCNYMFTFNSHTYEELIKKGIQTVYYAPLVVNTKRLNKIILSRSEREEYGSDVSFVGALYNERENFFEKIYDTLSDLNLEHTRGFIDAIIDAQTKIYGYNFLEHALPESIISNMQKGIPFQVDDHCYFTTVPYMYASYALSKRVTFLERKNLLTSLSHHFETKVFTIATDINLGNCILHESINHYDITPKVFKSSKINLNITLKSIETGIPLRAMDIMGAGGFLISNYQADFLLHFEPDKDFVFYESEEDLIDKVAYYLKHDTERKKIATCGYEKVAKDHTFEKRLSEMLNIVKHGGRI